MSSRPGANIHWFLCDDGHVHLAFLDENGEEIFGIVMDVEDWCDLANDIDEEIETKIAEEEAKEAVIH
jgi:hypothetical protein